MTERKFTASIRASVPQRDAHVTFHQKYDEVSQRMVAEITFVATSEESIEEAETNASALAVLFHAKIVEALAEAES